MKVNSRKVILELLNEVDNGSYSNKLIQDILTREDIDARDKGFISKILYGVVEQRIYLDYVIRKFSSVRLKKIDPSILNVLRLSAYQIIFLDKIPNSAVVDEAVKLSKKINKRHSGFVNGLLRNMIRKIDTVTLPDNDIERLSIKYSHPLWLVERWTGLFGLSFTEDLLRANNETPKLVLRCNTLLINREDLITKLQLEGLDVEISDIVEEGIIVHKLGEKNLDQLELFKSGHFTVQDESSMMIGHLLDPQVSDKVLDLCAAPGGKSTHLAQLMQNKGQVYACDISESKIKLIKENVKRLGLNNVRMMINDAALLNNEFIEAFDKVLLDAPCSGLGIIRRKPDIKYRKSEEDILALQDIQMGMLLHAAKYVKKGGVLVYSTCTIEPGENGELIDRFLAENQEYERVDGTNDLQLYPNVDETDGFFGCKLRRK